MENSAHISIKKIVDAASGKDESGFNKAAIGLFHETVDVGGNVTETVREVSCDTAVVEIHRNLRRVFTDIIFPTSMDVELHRINDLLKDAFSSANSVSDDGSTFTLVTLSIIPHEFDGRYYMLCTDPLFWALTAQEPRADLNTIRLVFDEDDFYVLAADEQALAEMSMEIQNEIAAEDRQAEFYEQQEERRRARNGR